MSAITGSGETRTIRGSASASSSFGTATRTTSQPAEASAAICAVVASTSCVLVSVIDWTTTGAPPPIVTPPTEIWRVLAICRVSLASAQPIQVVRQPDQEQEQHERDADDRHSLVDLAPDGTAAQPLDERERNVSAVEREQREQVHQGEREADQAEHPEVALRALFLGR